MPHRGSASAPLSLTNDHPSVAKRDSRPCPEASARSRSARIRFGLAAYRLGIRAGLLGPLEGAYGGGHQAAQVGLLADDLRVVRRAAGAVGRVGELEHVGRAADPLQVTLLLEQFGEDDRVGRPVLAVLGEEGAPDRFVRGPVERVVTEDGPDRVNDVGLVHAGAEDRALGVHVEGRLHRRGVLAEAGWRLGRQGRTLRHRAPHPAGHYGAATPAGAGFDRSGMDGCAVEPLLRPRCS